jgi:pentose-5-phosphate-3-epimerase
MSSRRPDYAPPWPISPRTPVTTVLDLPADVAVLAMSVEPGAGSGCLPATLTRWIGWPDAP